MQLPKTILSKGFHTFVSCSFRNLMSLTKIMTINMLVGFKRGLNNIMNNCKAKLIDNIQRGNGLQIFKM